MQQSLLPIQDHASRDGFVVRTRADDPTLAKAAGVVEQAAWAQLGFLNFTKAHFSFYEEILNHYADYQLCLIDQQTDYVVSAANCVPFYWDMDRDLPAEGWDWIVETAFRTRGKRPNMLGGLAVSVPSVYRSLGLARTMIAAMKRLAEQRGLKGPVIPVRPSQKSKHPFVPVEEYLSWRNEGGQLFDPWLRSHAAMGGKITGVAARSMVIEEPTGFWQAWTNQRFERSGRYLIEGGLVPVDIDIERGTGSYVEPNIWFSY